MSDERLVMALLAEGNPATEVAEEPRREFPLPPTSPLSSKGAAT